MLRAGKTPSFGLLLLVLSSSSAWSQGIFGTLTGVVTDPSQSVVPDAKSRCATWVGLRTPNCEQCGRFLHFRLGARRNLFPHGGSSRFKSHKEAAIRLGGGDSVTSMCSSGWRFNGNRRSLRRSGFTTVAADSGEKSFALETKELQNFTQVEATPPNTSRSFPGSAYRMEPRTSRITTDRPSGSMPTAIRESQSPLNTNYSYNGLPTNSLDITADGAHVSDPGCNCDTPVNPNSDFLQEFKVLTSNFSAEEQKGPVVISSVTKSGGSQFHGSGFFSAATTA